jgi:peptide/nickel transport system permease protein
VSAILGSPAPAATQESPGLWLLAWRRLRQDRVAMVCLVIVVFFLLMMIGSYAGLIASDWNKEKGVSYANPSFMAGAQNLEAKAMEERKAAH